MEGEVFRVAQCLQQWHGRNKDGVAILDDSPYS